ncbi:hypothetical protein QQZ08_005429 [Neonectria magnoliae]|uniref:Xylanolytic transcriptional activator regulatory domain-containing protein n=1 Tax=Neonectria magnoliae TaxID=2732573 RepID=A0ABR1I509_9HYPO
MHAILDFWPSLYPPHLLLQAVFDIKQERGTWPVEVIHPGLSVVFYGEEDDDKVASLYDNSDLIVVELDDARLPEYLDLAFKALKSRQPRVHIYHRSSKCFQKHLERWWQTSTMSRDCIRLNKMCQYPDVAVSDPITDPNIDSRLHHLEQLLSVNSTSPPETSTPVGTDVFRTGQGPAHPFPSSFFLDADFFTPLGENALARCPQPPLHQMAASHLGVDPVPTCAAYFSSVHTWLPITSRKRLMYELSTDPPDDAYLMLLVLCMKICTPGDETQPKESSSYKLAKSLCSTAEIEGYVSIRLVQSLVLLAVYEYCHAIHPAAFLTISRAARLGILMGLQDRKNSPQLFKPPETWTLREEHRRTWWAIFVLDR